MLKISRWFKIFLFQILHFPKYSVVGQLFSRFSWLAYSPSSITVHSGLRDSIYTFTAISVKVSSVAGCHTYLHHGCIKLLISVCLAARFTLTSLSVPVPSSEHLPTITYIVSINTDGSHDRSFKPGRVANAAAYTVILLISMLLADRPIGSLFWYWPWSGG